MIGTMKGGFSDKGISEFITNLLTGMGGLEALSDDFKVKKVDKWDGKDAAPFEEEYYDDL
jgi:hypothetical protein